MSTAELPCLLLLRPHLPAKGEHHLRYKHTATLLHTPRAVNQHWPDLPTEGEHDLLSKHAAASHNPEAMN
jgi:hypothetical protein